MTYYTRFGPQLFQLEDCSLIFKNMRAINNNSSKGKLVRYKVNGVSKSVWVAAFETVIVEEIENADDLLNATSRQKNELSVFYKDATGARNLFDGSGFVQDVSEQTKWKGAMGLIENGRTLEFASSTFSRYGNDPITLYYRPADADNFNELGTQFYLYPHDELPYGSDEILNGSYRLFLRSGEVSSRAPAVYTNILPENMGVVINANDPNSAALAATYRTTWGIPSGNTATVYLGSAEDMGANAAAITSARTSILLNMPANVQYLALCWRYPSRASSNSITWAITMGYSTISQDIDPLPTNPMWNYAGSTPYDSLGIRPSMLVYSGFVVQNAILAHGFRPSGTCYMLAANDQPQQPRGRARLTQMNALSASTQYVASGVSFNFTNNLGGTSGSNNGNNVLNKTDLMFYFNGMYTIYGMNTNTIRRGAIGDYVTSTSGNLPSGAGQTPISYLLENGFVGTAGSVIEPWQNAFQCGTVCQPGSGDLMDQFPNIDVLVNRYVNGRSLVEAYWKSLKQPPRILLLGDPMVAPFALNVTSGGTPSVQGCTNPYAENFNPSATTNDGSCTFAESEYVMTFSSTTVAQLVPQNLTPLIIQNTTSKQGQLIGGKMKIHDWANAARANIHYPCNFFGVWTVRYTDVTFSANSYQWLNNFLRIQPRTGGDTNSQIMFVFTDGTSQVVEGGYVNTNQEYGQLNLVMPYPVQLTSLVGKSGGSDNNACAMEFASVYIMKHIVR